MAYDIVSGLVAIKVLWVAIRQRPFELWIRVTVIAFYKRSVGKYYKMCLSHRSDMISTAAHETAKSFIIYNGWLVDRLRGSDATFGIFSDWNFERMTCAVNFTRYSNKTWGNIAGPRTLIGHAECRLKHLFLNVGLSLRNSTLNSNSDDTPRLLHISTSTAPWHYHLRGLILLSFWIFAGWKHLFPVGTCVFKHS